MLNQTFTETHDNISSREVDQVHVGGCLHVRVGENHHQHQHVPHHPHQEDQQVGKVQPQLYWYKEDITLLLLTYWPGG